MYIYIALFFFAFLKYVIFFCFFLFLSYTSLTHINRVAALNNILLRVEMESGNTGKDARQAKDALVLYEPGEDGEGKWILLHVLLRPEEGSPLEPTADDGLLRLSNNFNDWCRWRDEHAQVVTGTIIFSEAPEDNPKDMLIESLFIEKPYRRQGFGRRLVEGMRTVCRQRGRSRMLAATCFRAKAMPFWMAMGLQRELATGMPYIPVSKEVEK